GTRYQEPILRSYLIVISVPDTFSPSNSTLPDGWITSGVKDGDDHYLAGLLLVQHHIRESLNHRLADILVHGGMQLRVGRDSGEHVPHPVQKCRAQSGSPLFVPVHRGVELVSGLWQQAYGERRAHRARRARASASTCSHGIAACGFARW